jgi:hypothetical protein
VSPIATCFPVESASNALTRQRVHAQLVCSVADHTARIYAQTKHQNIPGGDSPFFRSAMRVWPIMLGLDSTETAVKDDACGVTRHSIAFKGQYTLLRVHRDIFGAWPHCTLVQKGSQDNAVTPWRVCASLGALASGAHTNAVRFKGSTCDDVCVVSYDAKARLGKKCCACRAPRLQRPFQRPFQRLKCQTSHSADLSFVCLLLYLSVRRSMSNSVLTRKQCCS